MPARRDEANGEWQQQMEVHIRPACCSIKDHQTIKAFNKQTLREQRSGPIMTISNRTFHFAAIEANWGVLERLFNGFRRRQKLDQYGKDRLNLSWRQVERVAETIKRQSISYTCTRDKKMDQMVMIRMWKRFIRGPCPSDIPLPWSARYRTLHGWKTRFARGCSSKWASSSATIRRHCKLSEM